MKLAELNRRVYLQAPSGAADELGGRPRTWSTAATVWAKIESVTGTRLAADSLRSGATMTAVIRKNSNATTKNSILWGTRRLMIEEVSEIDSQFLRLMCSEGGT